MIKKLFAICILMCGSLFIYVVNYEKQEKRAIPVSTSFYENVVAITFDDGPSAKYTDRLLDGLKERGVVATFFVLGSRVKGNEDIIKRMQSEGHLIGNHTYSHVKLDSLCLDNAINEIEKCNEAIKNITGCNVEYIRPPYGSYSDKLEDNVNMTKVLWTVDPMDWNTNNTKAIVDHVVNNAKDGDIILLHDIYETSVAAALEIIDQLKDKGFVFVTVDDIILN